MTAERIDPASARRRQRNGELVIDVRSAQEYASGHIAGAVNIPFEELGAATLPDGPVMTTCGGGGRGGRAADALVESGHEAYSIDGGTRAWQELGLPIESAL
ncbi:rhodanese-like domain-containing protein [Jatrophihabitans sp.]|uniref:rhodanese-like domain-containing protein n=1 Tax=Jatrophihabitans sp. TaxID=1932789 RepID=UPI0030C68394|nr:rhodanese-like protein [Jatrophihabitans sp.]